MEAKNPASTAASSSSFSSLSTDLFGPKDSPSASSSANSSSAGIFSHIFSPPSTRLGMDSSRSNSFGTRGEQNHGQVLNGKQASAGSIPQSSEQKSVLNKDGSSVFHNEIADPCSLSSSLYYGGRDICSQSPNARASGTGHNFKKDGGGEDDSDNSNIASRGNWWQGSLYY